MSFTIPGYDNSMAQGLQQEMPGYPQPGGYPQQGYDPIGGGMYSGGYPQPGGYDPTMYPGGYPQQGYDPMGAGMYPPQVETMPGNQGYNGQASPYPYAAQAAQGYYQAPVGRVDRQGMVHYTRSQYIEGLRAYVINSSGIQISSEERIEESPNLLRHACAVSRISMLPICYFNVPETGVQIPFYFCMSCGKLFYVKDFMF